MSWNITDRFPDWGETGESPPNGFFYEGEDQVNEKHLDYLWNSVKGLEDDVQSALDDIDSDSDGNVDAADTATDATNVTSTYKGNDIDSDGDGTVNAADTAAKVKGNDIDSDGDGNVDKADDADTLQGNTPSDLTESLADNSWQDVAANRSAGTTYTNTTGGFLKVKIPLLASNADNKLESILKVDGSNLDRVEIDASTSPVEYTVEALIPPNSDYTLTVSQGGIVEWQELTLELV